MVEKDREKKEQDEAKGTGCCDPETMARLTTGCCEGKTKGICGFIMRRLMKHRCCSPHNPAR